MSLDERRIIARMHEKKISQNEIARALRRDRSTISRELRRNFWRDEQVKIAEGYWHVTAHAMSVDRRRKYRKLVRHPDLCAALPAATATARPSLVPVSSLAMSSALIHTPSSCCFA